MTTTNEFNQEVFNNGTTVVMIITFAMINGIEKCESVIRNTYTRQDANSIIEILNSIN